MQPNEQWTFEVSVYLMNSKGGQVYEARIKSGHNNPLAEGMGGLTGQGNTPALAIANLFHQAYWTVEKAN